MTDEYMSIDDIRDLLGDPVYYPPEVVGMIAERVAQINASDLAHTVFFSINKFASYTVMSREADKADINIETIKKYIIKQHPMVAIDCTKELLDMYQSLEEWNV